MVLIGQRSAVNDVGDAAVIGCAGESNGIHGEGVRFYFFSREKRRLHVHVQGQDGEAKFWVEPAIELAQNYGLSQVSLRLAKRLITEREDEIRSAWEAHFKR